MLMATVTVQVNAGFTSIAGIFVQALDGSGTVEITISAPGYATDTSTITLTPSGFGFRVASLSTTTFSANSSIRMDFSYPSVQYFHSIL